MYARTWHYRFLRNVSEDSLFGEDQKNWFTVRHDEYESRVTNRHLNKTSLQWPSDTFATQKHSFIYERQRPYSARFKYLTMHWRQEAESTTSNQRILALLLFETACWQMGHYPFFVLTHSTEYARFGGVLEKGLWRGCSHLLLYNRAVTIANYFIFSKNYLFQTHMHRTKRVLVMQIVSGFC